MRQFNKRQQIYEKLYKRQFFTYLNSVNNNVAKSITENGLSVDLDSFLNYSRVESIYKKLYNRLTLEEAKLAYTELPGLKQKDIIDVLATLLTSFSGSDDIPIGIWRRLLNDFITVRIAGRITEVNSTTRIRLAHLIEDGISNGLGAEEVARNIRNDQNYNRNRSLAIARTETITAMNQGKYLAAQSSPYVMEKLWSPTIDKRTRLSHAAMKDAPWRDLNQFFELANDKGTLEQAQYPGDVTLSASNVINCRCSIVTRAKKDANGRLIRGRNEGVPLSTITEPPIKPQPKPIQQGFVPAKTIQEAEQRFLKFAPKVNFDGLPLDKQNEILNGIEDVLGKYKVTLTQDIGFQTNKSRSLGTAGRNFNNEPLYIKIQKTFAKNPIAEKNRTSEIFKRSKESRIKKWQLDIDRGNRPEILVEKLRGNIDKISNTNRWAMYQDSARPLYTTTVHEAYHSVYYKYKLENEFKKQLERFGVTVNERFNVSEYGASITSELWAEVGAAIENNISVPSNILNAFNETLKLIL